MLWTQKNKLKSTNGYVFTLGGVPRHENPSNKHVSLDPIYNQSLFLLIKLERKPNEFRTS